MRLTKKPAGLAGLIWFARWNLTLMLEFDLVPAWEYNVRFTKIVNKLGWPARNFALVTS